MESEKLFIDYGSGYNPCDGYKTADITGFPNLDFLIINNHIYNKDSELSKSSVDKFRLRNVIHHIKNLNELFEQLRYYIKDNGTIDIVECSKEYYNTNYYLDYLWYRFIIPRYEIWFSKNYRDYISAAESHGFIVTNRFKKDEKEYITLKAI